MRVDSIVAARDATRANSRRGLQFETAGRSLAQRRPSARGARGLPAVEEHGSRVWREMEEFDTADAGAHASWRPRFFTRFVDTDLAQAGNRGGRIRRRAVVSARCAAACSSSR
jgi:hypothetical protein